MAGEAGAPRANRPGPWAYLTVAPAGVAALVVALRVGLLATRADHGLLQMVAVLLPAAGLLLLALGIQLLLVGRWRQGLLWAALWAAAGTLPHMNRPAAGGAGDAFRVLTLNANPDHMEAGMGAAVLSRAEAEGVSVVAWQEFSMVFGPESSDHWGAAPVRPLIEDDQFRTMKPRVRSGGGPARSVRAHRQQNPVFTRLEWVSHEEGRLASALPEDERSPYTRAVVRWEGQEVAVYNVHLASYTAWRPWRDPSGLLRPRVWVEAARVLRADLRHRAVEARALREILAAERRPYLVVGDLNSTPQQHVYRIVSEGLTDAFAVAGRGFGFTFHARLPFVRIDYVLASPHWRVVRADVFRDIASDHRAVLAELTLKPEAPARPMP